jgi:hypothetical protein
MQAGRTQQAPAAATTPQGLAQAVVPHRAAQAASPRRPLRSDSGAPSARCVKEMARNRSVRPFWLLFVAGCAASACDGCEQDRPYTPFGVASSIAPTPTAASASASASASAQAGSQAVQFVPRAAREAPARTTRWSLDGVSLVAPQGRRIALALVADFDETQGPDAVLWTVPVGQSTVVSEGELWAHLAGRPPRRLLSTPGFVPTGAKCKARASLSLTGPRSVTVDLEADCGKVLIARSPVRSVSVLAPAAPRPVLVQTRVSAPAPGEKLTIGVDSTDRDQDGNDDVELQVRVQAHGTARPASARLLWLDRPAGTSRQPHEPVASLARAAGLEQVRAKGKNTSRTVPDGVGNLRRLIASLCAEGGTPRLLDAEGAPLRCGKLDRVVDRLATAEVRAALKQQQVAEAAAVLARDGWYFGRISRNRREQLEREITEACVPVEPASVVTLAAQPVPRAAEPRWSPLQFEQPEASLLVRTAQGLIRAAPDGSSENLVEEEAGTAAWPLAVTAPDGRVWTGVSQACNRSELLLTFSPQAAPAPAHILAARPGACTGRPIPSTPPPTPLGFKSGKLMAIVGGSAVGPGTDRAALLSRPPRAGSPRSADGKLLVLSTPLGLLVASDGEPELWRGPELKPWHALGDCVVAPGSRALGCVKSNRVLLIRR